MTLAFVRSAYGGEVVVNTTEEMAASWPTDGPAGGLDGHRRGVLVERRHRAGAPPDARGHAVEPALRDVGGGSQDRAHGDLLSVVQEQGGQRVRIVQAPMPGAPYTCV